MALKTKISIISSNVNITIPAFGHVCCAFVGFQGESMHMFTVASHHECKSLNKEAALLNEHAPGFMKVKCKLTSI